ncbi:hypothetical protein CAP35_10940 [Chitinophagaceae bacterium IBVUCB1]|nr:hypothetical protein CAP35_10940 [Chitinophagaceae bacterium IBVUCB1]
MPHTHHKHHQRSIHVSPTFRWIENAHILLWLIKDFCWAMEWKAGGIIMIFPTVSVAFYLLFKSRKVRAELYHNLAVCFWILANSTWMVGEFNDIDLRIYAATLFGSGLVVLAVYYALYFKKDSRVYNMD